MQRPCWGSHSDRRGCGGVMHDEPPSGRRAQKDIGRDRRPARLWLFAQGHMLDGALQRQAHRLDHHDLVELEGEFCVAREKLLPSGANRVIADEARPAGMHANNVLVLGPRCHHRVDVASFERLIKRECRVLRRGKDVRRASFRHRASALAQAEALRASAYTSSGESSRMHLKCPRGHSRLKQGLHSMSIFATRAMGERGGVYTGDEEPNNAISGRATAAAACIKPESLLTTIVASESRSIAVPRSVRPVMSRTAGTALAIG